MNSEASGLITVLADDLTGAAEIAGVGFRAGLTSVVVTDPDLVECPGSFICLDTDSRSMDAEKSNRSLHRAIAWARSRPAGMTLKKVDSALRGRILDELESLLQGLDYRRAILVPNNPSFGRNVRDGKYYIDDVPIHRTGFADDPEFPATTCNVLELLAEFTSSPQSVDSLTLKRPDEAIPEEGIIFGQVACQDDVEYWAGRVDIDTLPAGGIDFLTACLRVRGLSTNHVRRSRSRTAPPIQLFISGSTAPASRTEIATARRRGIPVLGMPPESAGVNGENAWTIGLKTWSRRVVAEMARTQQVVVNIGDVDAPGPDAPGRLSQRLSTLVRVVTKECEPEHIFAEGDATASAIISRMNWKYLEITREWAPGVVTVFVGGSQPQFFTMKPGSYPWPKEFWLAP